MATTATTPLRIVANGGPITKDVYMAYYDDGGAENEDWKAGEILHLSGTGKLARSDAAEGSGTFGTVAAIDNDAPFDAAHKWFLALEDHDSSVKGKSVYASVQEIMADTVFQIQCAASSTTAPASSALLQGVDGYGVYISTLGVWGLDVDDATLGMFVLEKKHGDLFPAKASVAVAGTNGTGDLVYVRLVGNIIL